MLQFGMAWGLDAIVSHNVAERVIRRGFLHVLTAIHPL